MGNFISRKLSNSRKSTKVIFPGGEIRQIHQQTPTKAAELMMEAPNFFIVNTKSLKIGKRFCPLNADNDIEKGNVYVMFPMHRKNSVVTGGDMAVLFFSTNKALKRASKVNNSNNIKVLPESDQSSTGGDSAEDVALPKLSLEGIEDVATRHRLSMSRSKKPSLQTIQEESTRSR